MWTNRLKEMVSNGGVAYVALVTEFPSADVAEYMALLGFDAVLIDAEHTGVDPVQSREMFRAVTAGGATPLVRTPYNDPDLILGYLDAGAQGIVVPHSCTADDVQASARACRYPPLGTRGAAWAARGSMYGTAGAPRATFDNANREVMTIPLLEDVEAIDNLDEIIAVDGADALFVGVGDLALSMGVEYGDPAVVELAGSAVRRIAAAGRVAMTAVTTLDDARQAVSNGARIITIQPFGLFRNAIRDWLQEAKAIDQN